MGEMRKAYPILVRKPEGIGAVGRLTLTMEENNEMKLKGTGCEVLNGLHLSRDRRQ
jgi:hypothetical protein